MTFYHDTPTNIQHLVDLIPGLPGVVVKAWLRCEGQATNNPTNPLNILYYGREDRNQIGQRGRFAVYPSAYAGLKDAAWLITRSSYYAGVRAALGTRDPIKIANAIEESPWAAGHYGRVGAAEGCITRGTRRNLSQIPTPTPTPTPIPTPTPTTRKYKVVKGDSLWKIATRFYGKGLLWQRIYSANKAIIGPNPSLIHPGQVLIIPE